MDDINNAFNRFLGQAAAHSPSINSFWDLKEAFRTLVLSGFFQNWVNKHLAEIVRAPSEAGLWFWPQFNVKKINDFGLSVIVITQYSVLQTSPEPAMYAPVGSEDIQCEVYRIPSHSNEVFDTTIALEPVQSVRVGVGDIFEVRPEHVHDFRGARNGQLAVTAVLSAPSTSRFKWTFDRNSLKALSFTSADPVDTQLQSACDLLGQLGDLSSLEVLENLINHPNQSVRWKAIQNTVRIKPATARSWLERAVTDSHPHIQAAATKALRNLKAES